MEKSFDNGVPERRRTNNDVYIAKSQWIWKNNWSDGFSMIYITPTSVPFGIQSEANRLSPRDRSLKWLARIIKDDVFEECRKQVGVRYDVHAM